MGELPQGWSLMYLGSVSFQLQSQDPHHGDDGGTGVFVPFYLKLPGIFWRGKVNLRVSAKPVALGKKMVTELPGTNPGVEKG